VNPSDLSEILHGEASWEHGKGILWAKGGFRMTQDDKTRERLLGPDTDRLAREHPDLAEQLRRYQREWRIFRESVGGGSGKAPTMPVRKRQYRA